MFPYGSSRGRGNRDTEPTMTLLDNQPKFSSEKDTHLIFLGCWGFAFGDDTFLMLSDTRVFVGRVVHEHHPREQAQKGQSTWGWIQETRASQDVHFLQADLGISSVLAVFIKKDLYEKVWV